MKAGTSMMAFAITAVLTVTAPLAASAQSTTMEATSAPGKVGAKQTAKMTATVVSIDMVTRDLVLIDSQGKMHKINVSDQARNLDQVRVGDKVTAEYTEAISFELKKRGAAGPSGAPPVDVTHAMVRSPKGAKPGGVIGRQVTALATVVSVDQKKQTVVLRGPEGNEFEVQAADPAQLKAVTKGDEVEVVYTEALAISVTAAPSPQ